jgi:uncharacterized protein (TIGR02284 family)
MAARNDDMISTLNELIEICKDGENGFRSAAEGISDSELQSLFRSYSEQRALFASELRTEVRRLGGNPEKTGSVAGAMHRGWINIKSAVTGEDEAAIIAECERGEDAAVAAYEEALAKDLSSEAKAVVRRQYAQVQQAHDRIRALELATQ